MARNTRIAISVAAAGVLCAALAQNGSPITGQWTLGGSTIQEKTQLTISRNSLGHNMNSSSPIALSELRGLSQAQLGSTGSNVKFEIVRDAGTLRFEGFVRNGGGGGTFVFSPNTGFASEMGALGYGNLSDEQVFTMAVHDISLAYVRDLNALGIRPESSEQLITMRIHNVTPEYVRDFQGLGYTSLTPEKLVTMRIHSVTIGFARDLQTLGYNSVSPEQMVTMQIHGASTDFIKEVVSLGYSHPAIEQLVTMRIHGVTPDFIRKTRSQGLGNLPIEQLVNLKIHGIVE
jgi:hypothetical protein